MRNKVSIIGAGNVGATCALWIHARDLADTVLIDVQEGQARGKSLDIWQTDALLQVDLRATGGGDYRATEGSDIVVIAAGMARKPNMSRDDLVKMNVEIVKDVAAQAVAASPHCVLIVVSNPLDAMVYAASRVSGLPKNRIMGMAGILDSARFRVFLAEKLGVSVRDVSAVVLGGHGDSMVPLVRLATVGGVPISELMTESDLEAIIKRTRMAGGEFLEHLGTSAWVSPGLAVSLMVEAILLDQKRVLPCAAYVSGEYGYSDIFIGVPVVLGRQGIERIVEVKLSDQEKRAFARTVQHVRDLCRTVDSLL
jgi:malate dehydrogenase